MMRKSERRMKQVVFFIGFIFHCGWMGLGNDAQTRNQEKLKTELTAVFQSKGEPGVRDFVKDKIDSIESKFIVEFAENGVKDRKKESLDVCLVLAEEKKDEKTLADVFYNRGEFFRLTSNNIEAFDSFEKAFRIYLKINDPIGQGYVYIKKGLIYLKKGESEKTSEMCEIAMPLFEKAGDIKGQGEVFRCKGDIFYYAGKNPEALEMYNRSLSFFNKVEDQQGKGNVYLKIGLVYFYTGDNKKALEMCENAQICFEKAGDLNGQGNVYRNRGDVYFRSGNYPGALDMYDKAMDIFMKVMDFNGQGIIYMRKGEIYRMTGNFSDAIKMYDKALILYEKAGDVLGQANIYKYKGDFYVHMGDNSRALEMYDRALYLYEKSGEPLGQGYLYLSKGDIYLYIHGDITKALECYNKALSCFEKADDPVGIGNVFFIKGDICLVKGENFEALKMYNKAQFFFEKVNVPISQGNSYKRKGDIYFQTGDLLNAIKMYDKAMDFFKKTNASIDQGNVYKGYGDIYLSLNDLPKALEMYDNALPLYERAQEHQGQGNVYMSKGDVYLNSGENSSAQEMYDKALTFFEKSGRVLSQGHLYQSKGHLYLKIGSLKKALDMYEKALSIYVKLGDIGDESSTLIGKARVLLKSGKKDDALSLFEKSISKLEKFRAQLGFSGIKGTFMEKVYKNYEEAAVFMLGNKQHRKGFKYVELMKARVFSDRLSEELIPLEKGIPQEYRQKRDDMVSKLSIFSKRIDEAANKNDKEKLKELNEQYRSLQTDFDQLLAKIRIDNPFYAAVQYPEPVTLQELQNVLKEDELMLRYFVSPDKLYAFIISKKEFNVIPIEINEASINQLVENYLDSIGIKDSVEIQKYSTRLANAVFKPLKGNLNNSKNIIIVPDGELIKVPFESYIIDRDDSRNPIYLVSEYRVKYVQSATVLALIRKHYKREGTTNHFIGFGDPVYDYENFIKGKQEVGALSPGKGNITGEIHHNKYAREGGVFVRLRGSGEEVKTIAHFFDQQPQKPLIHERLEANETNAKSSDLINFDYIHFSCHGVMGDGFQGLVLSQVPGSPEDGYLTLNEIMNCDYNAKLVVLSACQTGKGEMTKGEGVTGLTQAVMYAGTPAVVASLWGVDEDATKDLLVAFYKYMLEEGMTKDEALRKAKLALINSEKYASPYYWAAFVMYGE